MKYTMKLSALIFGVLILANAAYADSPREQLTQMVEQLQKSPNDTALREKIIKLALYIRPAPAVPEEAERHMAYGTAAFTGAKSLADYKESVKEFEQATLAAPWYGDAYFNLGVAQDKAENYEAALRSLNLARLALADSKDIKTLIYQVEYRNKKANSPQAQITKDKENADDLLRSLNDARYFEHRIAPETYEMDKVYEVHGDTLFCRHRITAIYDKEGTYTLVGATKIGDEKACGNWRWRSGRFIEEYPLGRMIFTPSADRQMLSFESWREGKLLERRNIQRQ